MTSKYVKQRGWETLVVIWILNEHMETLKKWDEFNECNVFKENLFVVVDILITLSWFFYSRNYI